MTAAGSERGRACDHRWTYREIDGETWNVCIACGFGEMWAAGNLIKTTDERESERLNPENTS